MESNQSNKKPFSLKERLASFPPAFKGILVMIRDEHNARIHLAAAIITIGLGLWCDIEAWEWLMIALAITLVFVTELINTAIEGLVDWISPGFDPRAGKIKDTAAAAVLVSAFFALLVAGIVFIPRLTHYLF